MNLAYAESAEEAKPSFDCAKATTKVEKMICEDSSGELQELDSMMAQRYKEAKAQLTIQDKKELLGNQRFYLKQLQQCESKECVKKSLQNRVKELQTYTIYTNNGWLGIYRLRQNLYEGELTIQKCNTNNTCEASYSALLHRSEFNDIHECDITLKLQIQSPQEAIAINDDADFANCKIYIKKNQQGIIFTRNKETFDSSDSLCYTMCGNQTIFEWENIYKKETR